MSSTNRPRAFSYLRMSTPDQVRGDSMRRQIEASRAYAERHGLDLQEEDQLADLGISVFTGANVAAGALGGFLEATRAGKVPKGSVLLVESLDRISRQEVLRSLGIFIEIVNAGITIVTLVDNRTYTTETGFEELIFSIVAMSRAHDESRTKSIRLKSAWKNKRDNAGTRPLTAICPAWLKLSRDRARYEVIENRAAVVRRIFEESASGIGNYSITRRLNMDRVPHFGRSKGWHQSYVSKILRSRAVIGEFQPHRLINGKRRSDGDPVRGYFPAIVDEQTFYRAQLGLSQRVTVGAGRKGPIISNLFSGVMTCAYCRGPVRFENKGSGPKGGTFLVCDGAKRGLGCEAARWRYEHFEAAFLAFVREVDLEQIVHSEDEARKRLVLESLITALQGEQTAIKQQMEKTYELLSMAGAATNFVAEKLRQLEDRRSAIEAELCEKEQERSQLRLATSQFYESKDQIKALIEQLQSRKGDETYKLRSQIASKLRSLVATILVAPLGHAPLTEKAIAFISSKPEAQPVIDHLKWTLDNEFAHRRYFSVAFADGSSRAVYPNQDDPLQFEQQVLGNREGVFRINPSGHVDDVFKLLGESLGRPQAAR